MFTGKMLYMCNLTIDFLEKKKLLNTKVVVSYNAVDLNSDNEIPAYVF